MYEIKSLFKLASEFTQRVIFSYCIMWLFRLIISRASVFGLDSGRTMFGFQMA